MVTNIATAATAMTAAVVQPSHLSTGGLTRSPITFRLLVKRTTGVRFQRGKTEADEHGWSPNFADYLFLAFNSSTAFSPTDAPVLARWAKLLMMLQSLIALTVLVLLAARAVNIL